MSFSLVPHSWLTSRRVNTLLLRRGEDQGVRGKGKENVGLGGILQGRFKISAVSGISVMIYCGGWRVLR